MFVGLARRRVDARQEHLFSAQTPGQALGHGTGHEALRGQLRRWVSDEVPTISLANLPEIMVLINRAQEAQRTLIDDYYLDNLTLVELIQRLDEKMAFYKNIALFLQVFVRILQALQKR